MKLKFTKMQGAGNDFVVVDATTRAFNLSSRQINQLANRRFGIGFDQLLVVGASEQPEVDFSYRIFNADGTEASQCGNGARCFVTFVHDKKLTKKREIVVKTQAGIIKPRLNSDGSVSVDMGEPEFKPDQIPLLADKEQNGYSITINGSHMEFGAVSMGNPHAILIVENIDVAPVKTTGPLLENNAMFPERVNVNFMQICSRQNITLRVWERGAGETLSCGTGACASVVHGIKIGLLDSPCLVSAQGGDLTISWAGTGNAVFLRGPAQSIFDGEIDIETNEQ
ncbi:MAG: diaminopimelate epimerase [Proteobacteria bacterium]|nr:diaminopimelate epimerase [Pseudomonadota bacterium]MDA1331582.1 diaminopimelate epimerase [Pseudomonadota bacterium]